jgi:hypothetical protein
VTALLETSFVTGLFVPAGAALSFATAFALGQGSSLPMTMGVAAGKGWHWVDQMFGLDGAKVVVGGGGLRWIRGAPPVHPVVSAEEMRW